MNKVLLEALTNNSDSKFTRIDKLIWFPDTESELILDQGQRLLHSHPFFRTQRLSDDTTDQLPARAQ